jgi:hypothetical protein
MNILKYVFSLSSTFCAATVMSLSVALSGECSDAGDICADGSVLAGYSQDGSATIFTTKEDASGTFAWRKQSKLYPTFSEYTSERNGDLNTKALIYSPIRRYYEAARYCHDLSVNGHEDWFLPSKSELALLFNNRSAIGGFEATWYWSSSSATDLFSYTVDFLDGKSDAAPKSSTNNVRCIRADRHPPVN